MIRMDNVLRTLNIASLSHDSMRDKETKHEVVKDLA